MDLAGIKVVVFCGGRGSATIIQELLRWPHLQVTLIVNAYDDGLSTGALRNFIDDMLGPSDFRKNLSYLFYPHSPEQYSLKKLLEFRLPKTPAREQYKNVDDFLLRFSYLFAQVEKEVFVRIQSLLAVFFDYAKEQALTFDFRDCSLGNLIFAGAYLQQNKNFNAATKIMSELVSSRAHLLNVSEGENRVLVGLKADGELLANEAAIVSSQSPVPIRNIFLLPQPINTTEWEALQKKSLAEKETWLKQCEQLPQISLEAQSALDEADIIIFGPGTQHSSLFPSYKIAKKAIAASPARIKALIMNLEPDHDIQTLAANDVVDAALFYLQSETAQVNSISHVFLNNSFTSTQIDLGKMNSLSYYKNVAIIIDEYANRFKKSVHNGRKVVDQVLSLWKETNNPLSNTKSIDIFIDIHKRSLAMAAVTEEFLEMDWKKYSAEVVLTINNHSLAEIQTPHQNIIESKQTGIFPEVVFFAEWLMQKNSEYLVLLTGDGEYRFRDVLLGIDLLEQSHFGAVFGSRTQSRLQFKKSIQAAYGEKKFLRKVSVLGSFMMTAVFAARFGMIFSDPLTGFRIFKRSQISPLLQEIIIKKKTTPISIAKFLIAHKVEIAELPVHYKTFSGFTDPNWRMRRGLKNLWSIFKF